MLNILGGGKRCVAQGGGLSSPRLPAPISRRIAAPIPQPILRLQHLAHDPPRLRPSVPGFGRGLAGPGRTLVALDRRAHERVEDRPRRRAQGLGRTPELDHPAQHAVELVPVRLAPLPPRAEQHRGLDPRLGQLAPLGGDRARVEVAGLGQAVRAHLLAHAADEKPPDDRRLGLCLLGGVEHREEVGLEQFGAVAREQGGEAAVLLTAALDPLAERLDDTPDIRGGEEFGRWPRRGVEHRPSLAERPHPGLFEGGGAALVKC